MRYLHTIIGWIPFVTKGLAKLVLTGGEAGSGRAAVHWKPVLGAVFFAATALGMHSVAQAVTGKTPGSFNVSPTGAANYSIPIWAPPGPHGLQPSLAVVYNHRSGGGSLGPGWSLAGLSSITRCVKTIAQDGAAAPITLTYNDVFCLDGARLRLTSSDTLTTYGQDSTTYQTEIADFSNITAHGTQGNGPAYFTVQGKNGLTYEYGNGNNSQVKGADSASTAVAWFLDQVTDRAGNKLVISYLAPSATLSGTTLPSSISWTPTSHGSSSYSYSMQFAYTTNLPQSSVSAYVAGTAVINQDLLTSITVQNSSGATIKEYVFGYDTSPTTGGNRLTSVTECAYPGTSNCLIPTTITYQPGSAGVAGSASTLASDNDGRSPYRYDINGDGFPDLVYSTASGGRIAFGSVSGFSAPVSYSLPSGGVATLFGDLLGTGKVGVLAVNGTTWYYYTWNGTAFVGSPTNLTYDSTAQQYLLADIDGDGRADLVAVYQTATTKRIVLQINTYLNTSTATAVSFGAAVNAAGYAAPLSNSYSYEVASEGQSGTYPIAGPPHNFDFNGDGRQDLLLTINYGPNCGQPPCVGGIYELLSNGSTFSMFQVSASYSPALVTLLDFNSDGCTDFLAGSTIYISGCNGSAPSSISVPSGTIIGAMDWDGDGRTDILVANGSTVGVYLSTGVGLGSLSSTSIPYSASYTYFTADANGDGLDDLGYFNSSSSGGVIAWYPHNGAGSPADLLISVSDGYGISFNPTYTSMLWGSYSHSANATTYPEADFHQPLYVVNQATLSDGIGGTYTRTYSYVGARENLNGRGFEGFESQTTSDSRAASLVTTATYQQAFPFTGLTSQVDTFQHDGVTVVSHATYTNQDTVLHSTVYNQRHFPNLQSATVQSHEVGGPKNGALITTVSRTNSFDSYGNATNVATTVTDSDSSSPYYNQQWSSTTATTFAAADTGTNWCLTQPLQTTVTNTAPGVSAITRTTSFNNPADYVNCRVNQIITEPSSSTYAVTRSLGYDAFGNVNTVTVTGAGMAARTSTVDWGTTGQFPVTLRDPVSNALGSSGYQIVKGYDPNLGVQTSEVVQSVDGTTNNAPATTWSYDGFGRRTQEVRPDGVATHWNYYDCASDVGCPVGSHALAVQHYIQNTDGTVQTDGTTWFDQLDRPVRSIAHLLANATYNLTGVQYDNFGRVSVQLIPCTYSNSVAPCPYGVTMSYDALGRVTQTQRPINATNTTLQTTTVQYAGRTTVATDPYGKTTTKITTVVGTLGVSQDHNGYHQTFNYDAFGSLLSVTDSLSNTLFSADYDYGIGAFQRDVVDMDLDLSATSGQHRHYNYDALGELTSWTDAKGQSFSAVYDALSRPLSRTEPDLTTNWTWGASAANHNVGQPAVVSANSYTETSTYDSFARLANRSVTIPSDATYGYDFAYNGTTGLLDTLTYPTSTSSYRLKLSYTYSNGILSKVSDANAGTVYWQANSTNARGQVTQETLGNGVVTNRAFDAVTGWLSSVTSGLNGTAALQNDSYLYDEMGNVTQRQNNNAGLTENFYYDNVYRLDHSSLNGTINLQMGYGADGNITSRSDLVGGATWTYDATHKHAVTQAGSSTNTYSYDANGNAISRNGLGITWTSYNHPSVVNNTGSGESVQFAYNQNHERWSAIYNGSAGVETTYFIGDLLEKVSSAGASDYRHYIYAGGTKVAIYSRTTGGVNTLHYVREDHQGGVDAILNGDGTAYVKESFTAFGARRSACTWSGQPTNGTLNKINAVTRHGYTWQTALGAMGLNDMSGRIQDAVTGRFLSADPTMPNLGNTQSFNRYSYVNNNPLSYSDPTGFSAYKKCIDICGTLKRHVADEGSLGPGSNPSMATTEGGVTGSTVTDVATVETTYTITFVSPSDDGSEGAGGNSGAASDGGSGGNSSGGASEAEAASGSSSGSSQSTPQGDASQEVTVTAPGQTGNSTLPLVVVAYNGYFHNDLVRALANQLRSLGVGVATGPKICLSGSSSCAHPDLLFKDPVSGLLQLVEVKTGDKSDFTPDQLLVYPHLDAPNALISASPQLTTFGILPGQTLPPIVGWVWFQTDISTPRVIIPMKAFFP